MKKYLPLLVILFITPRVWAQADKYPLPEYGNEICLIKKDTGTTLMRLEKGTSKQEMKMKMMGMGGMEQGYMIDGEKSPVRLTSGSNLVFMIYTGDVTASSSSSSTSNTQSDSMMRASGIDPAMMANSMSMMEDPSKTTSLYEMKPDKGVRKILTQASGLMGKSKKTATKYTLSVKKVKDHYFEIIVDKSLPKGEYSFVVMSMGMDQSYLLFAFGID
jgi:hypothetical protein